MRPIKPFEQFIQDSTARTSTPDIQRAMSLLSESERKLRSLDEMQDKIGIKDDNANDFVEYCYDILIFLLRAKMCCEGFASSGHSAHEAEVSYMQQLGFDEKDVRFMNQLRYFRNGILYYGKRFDDVYAKKAIDYTKRISKVLREMIP